MLSPDYLIIGVIYHAGAVLKVVVRMPKVM